MHNARLVDPLDMVVKKIREVSTKTKKTDEDHEEIEGARAKFDRHAVG